MTYAEEMAKATKEAIDKKKQKEQEEEDERRRQYEHDVQMFENELDKWFNDSIKVNIQVAASKGLFSVTIDLRWKYYDAASKYLQAKGFRTERSSHDMRYSDDTPEVTIETIRIGW